jgi:hypothetical protein
MWFIAINAAGRLVRIAKIVQIQLQKKKEIPIINVVVQLIILWMIYKEVDSIGAKLVQILGQLKRIFKMLNKIYIVVNLIMEIFFSFTNQVKVLLIWIFIMLI